MIDLKLVLGAAAVAVALPCALSAQPVTAPAPPQDAVFYVAGGAGVMPFGGQVDVIGGEGAVIGGVVKDKPYTADSVTESTQMLADGNRITHRNEARFYRDSQGRTRREQTLNGLGVWQTANEPLTMVTINDPVADVSYFIDPVGRTARKLQPFRLALGDNATWTQAVPALPLPAPPPLPPGAGRQVFIDRGVVTTGVSVGRSPDPSGAVPAPFEVAVLPPGVAMRGTIAAGVPGTRVGMQTFSTGSTVAALPVPGVQPVTEDLGTQVLEGVLASGTRQTQTIPAGTIGNERAIEIVAEQWYSKDIEAVVLRRNVDPRFGETSYRLVHLVRSEPSPDLFAVPQGYELQTEPAFAPQHVELRSFGPAGEQGANEALPPPGGRLERRVFMVQPDPSATPK